MTKLNSSSLTNQDPIIRKGFIKKEGGPDSLYVEQQLNNMINEHGGMQGVERVIYKNVNETLGVHTNKIYMKDGTEIRYTEFVKRRNSNEPSIELCSVQNNKITEYYTTGDKYGDCFIDDIDSLNCCSEGPEKDICPS